jgi:Domain of unknown function (DUF4388)
MGFTGDLRTIDLPEVLQWIARGHQTGTLVVERGAIRKSVVFEGGLIHSSASNDPREYLGQYLIREGFVGEEDLFNALLRQEKEGWPLGVIVVQEGRLTHDQLRAILREKAEETLYDLFLWVEGAFTFQDGDVPENLPVHLALDVTTVILEGARRADEWSRIRRSIPSTRTTFAPTGKPADDPLERAVVLLAGSGRTFAGIAMELRRSDFKTATVLYDLLRRDVLRVSAPGGVDRISDTVSAIAKLLDQARRAMVQERWDDAVNALEAVLLLDRLNLDAKKGLLVIAEVRSRRSPLPEIPLNAVPRLARDLSGLTGETFDPLEGFVLSRINGAWPVRAILKLCPVPEPEARRVIARLVQRGVVRLDAP